MTWIFDLPFLLRGAAIGLAISAPVGPIGVLSIQRTLTEGRIAGLVTGLGAATADAAYSAIAALRLALISEFLVGQQPLVRMLGGGFLIYLGIKTLVSQFAEEPAPNGKRGLLGAFASTFVLTLTNPITIIYIAAIFAGLGAATTGGDFLGGGSAGPGGVSRIGALVVPAHRRGLVAARSSHTKGEEMGQPRLGCDHYNFRGSSLNLFHGCLARLHRSSESSA